MTTMPPRTPQEAAMLGLLAPNMSRGIFGAGRRRGARGVAGATMQPANLAGEEAPPITDAPPPPANWKNVLGPDLLAQIPQLPQREPSGLQGEVLPPAPPMRGGPLAQHGMFGSMAASMSDKIGNRGAPPMPDANSKGKKGIDWRMIAGIVGDALGSLNGQPPLFAQHMWKERQAQADHKRSLAEWMLRSQLDAAKPDFATINNRRVKIDPTTGQSEVLYTAPQDFEDYAAALGAMPGTEEYDRLVQDYVLRGGGPTATDNYNIREDWRQENRLELEGERQSNRVALEGQRQSGRRALRGVPTYRQLNPLPRSRSSGRSGGGAREGATATNPRTGEKVVLRGGKWVPAK